MISNKKAYYEYFIIEEYTAGIKLLGSEVKSLREGNASLNDTYIFIVNNDVFIRGMYISKYKQSSYLNHEERSDRKLLLTKREIENIKKHLKINGITMVPLNIFLKNGMFKMKIAIAKGKKNWDKKETIKEKDIKRQTNRELYE